MPRNVSLAVSVKDNATAVLSKVSGSLSKLQQDADKTGAKVDQLNKRKATISVDAAKAKRELKEAEKALDNTKEAADRLEQARYTYEGIQTELRSVTSEAKSAERQLNSLNDAISRQQNRAGGISGGGSDALSRLGQAGGAQLIGSVLSEAAGTYAASAFGSDTANMLSSVLGTAATGAAIGSVVAPGIGTAIGAGAGALLGGISGMTQQYANKDEYYKGIVQEQYNTLQQEQQETLSSGVETAASREQSMLAFSTLLGSEDAAGFLSQLQDFASRTPFSRSGLEQISKNLIASGFDDTNEQLAMMTAIGDAGSALGMSESSMADVATYLGRMNSTGKTTLEYLIPLMERSIPAVDYLAEHFGIAKEEVYDMVSKGLIPGAEAARAIAEGMGADFANSMELQAQTYSGLSSTLADAQEELDAAMGEGYNETRKPALQEQIDYLEGDGGAEMKEMYRLIGTFQASLENEKETAIREAMENVMETDEYEQARLSGDGAKMGELLAKAKADAEAAYTNSAAYEQLTQSQTKLIEDVQDAVSDSAWDAGYALGQKLTEGMAAAIERENATNGIYVPAWAMQTARLPEDAPSYNPFTDRVAPPHASGLSYVPYDGYPARLHEGERVLTAREAREYRAGVQVSVTGNSFVIREEADIDRVAEVIAQKVTEARELAG